MIVPVLCGKYFKNLEFRLHAQVLDIFGEALRQFTAKIVMNLARWFSSTV